MTRITRMEEGILYKDLSYKIVGLAMQVHTELGFGFLEKVYENSLMILFEENRIRAVQQVPILVPFHGKIVGEYIADIVVEDSIILELKALDRIAEIHKAQTLNYLKATSFRLALLLNFGKHRLEYERLVR
ncbi:MAG: GxxExxY protein [Blastocatellia bacterium]